MANSSARSPGTGIPGTTMQATRTALARSHPTSTRRAGRRSAAAPSRAPPSRYGKNDSASTEAASAGERGLLIDQHGERARRHNAPQHGYNVCDEDHPELAGTEHVTVTRPAGRRAQAGGSAGPLVSRGHSNQVRWRLVSELHIRQEPNNSGGCAGAPG